MPNWVVVISTIWLQVRSVGGKVGVADATSLLVGVGHQLVVRQSSSFVISQLEEVREWRSRIRRTPLS